MKRFWYIVIALVGLSVLGARADTVQTEAMLIYASNDPAPLDYHLDKVVPKLRSVLKFQNYELLGHGDGAVNAPGETTIDLGKGHKLEVKVRPDKKDRFKVEVRWLHNDKVQVSTGATTGRNQPIVLGGIKHANGNLVVTLILK